MSLSGYQRAQGSWPVYFNIALIIYMVYGSFTDVYTVQFNSFSKFFYLVVENLCHRRCLSLASMNLISRP